VGMDDGDVVAMDKWSVIMLKNDCSLETIWKKIKVIGPETKLSSRQLM